MSLPYKYEQAEANVDEALTRLAEEFMISIDHANYTYALGIAKELVQRIENRDREVECELGNIYSGIADRMEDR